jgi:hypothetical protein
LQFDAVKGYIKFSVNMYTSGDIPENLGDEPLNAKKQKGKKGEQDVSTGIIDLNVMMPPQLKTKPY